MISVTPVILCGGSGTRLWPLSRTGFPKQFLCLTGKESLFQQAALRLANLGNADIKVTSPIIVTGEDHRFLASEQLCEVGVELRCALLEPVGRIAAPALTLAALAAMEGGADPLVLSRQPINGGERRRLHLCHATSSGRGCQRPHRHFGRDAGQARNGLWLHPNQPS